MGVRSEPVEEDTDSAGEEREEESEGVCGRDSRTIGAGIGCEKE